MNAVLGTTITHERSTMPETADAAILEAGYPHPKARAAGEAFEAGAREEWRRIGGAERPAVWGTA